MFCLFFNAITLPDIFIAQVPSFKSQFFIILLSDPNSIKGLPQKSSLLHVLGMDTHFYWS